MNSIHQVIHKRVAPYFALYQEMVNLSTFMIVSHRNLLSLYDMGPSDKWIDTIKLSNDFIREIVIEKRPVELRESLGG